MTPNIISGTTEPTTPVDYAGSDKVIVRKSGFRGIPPTIAPTIFCVVPTLAPKFVLVPELLVEPFEGLGSPDEDFGYWCGWMSPR